MFCVDLVTADIVSTSTETPRASGLASAEGAADEDEEEKKEDQEPTEKNKGKLTICQIRTS